jgi:RNA polymerase sigma factor (sigma-70 family)
LRIFYESLRHVEAKDVKVHIGEFGCFNTIFLQSEPRYLSVICYIYYVVIFIILSSEEFDRLKKRDREILKRLYEYYKKIITTYFTVKTFGNRALADDLTHETFCSIIESVSGLKTKERLYFWILTIAKRTLIAYQRKLYRDKKYIEILKHQHHDQEDVVETLNRKQKVLLLTMAIESLNPRYREIYTMRYIQQKKLKDIAVKIGRTEKAVDNILTRIRDSIKKKMMKIADNFFEE